MHVLLSSAVEGGHTQKPLDILNVSSGQPHVLFDSKVILLSQIAHSFVDKQLLQYKMLQITHVRPAGLVVCPFGHIHY